MYVYNYPSLATALKANIKGEKSSKPIPFQNVCKGKLRLHN